MKRNWLWLLAGGLAACGGQVQVAPEVVLKHQQDAALQRQVQQLQASQVKVAASPASSAGPAVLSLVVTGPRNQPGRPDTLRQRVRKLAHLVAVDLAQPEKYQAMSVEVITRKGFFDKNPTSQSFIYPLGSLR